MMQKSVRGHLLVVFVILMEGLLCPRVSAQDGAPALTVPAGFSAQLYANDDLAHDIHSLTVDASGRVVVSGPGYVRILLDTDQDGTADDYIQYADKPDTGSQGMFFLGSSLLCSGDEGLLLFRDADGDDRADGPPQTFLKVSAGGEHHVHSIQHGPDGWWYINAGNYAGVTDAYATLATSPLKQPQAGVLMRLKPNLAGGEIIADGFRNAYDFAFTPSGDIFTFDSDGERDISLPWYRPTRVFQITPKSNAGWVSRSWKKPATFSDMPPMIAEFGRGSPTGVLCYRHSQFPEEYQNAIFVLDWTIGRVFALPLEPNGSTWQTEPIEFADARGQFGFAPTDAAVGPDGSLFISVGGRGTAGGVFRIVHDEGLKTLTAGTSESADTAEEMTLDEVLTANQPLSSWSRKRWLPAARRLGAAPFRQAAIDERRQTTERVRAIEILVEVFGEPDSSTATVLASAGAAEVRARLAWAVGRLNPESPAQDIISRLLVDRDPIVQRIALEALVGVSDSAALTAFLPGIARGLTAEDRHTRLAAASLVEQLSQPQVAALRLQLQSSPAGQVWLAIGQQLRPVSVSIAAATTAVNVVVDSATPAALRADALRLLQLSLGDVGPGEGRDAVFDSYGTPLDLRPYESRLNPLLAQLFETFPSGQPLFDSEMVRMIAVTSPYNRVLFGKVLAQITPESRPADDVHRLIALARFEIERSFEETTATARALLNVDVKIRKAGLRQDSNWDDRIGELYKALCSVDPALPQLLVEQPEFGEPGHVLYMDRVPQPQVELAIQKFVQRIADDDSFGWTNDVVFLIGESKTPQHLELLIEQLENLAVRDAVLIVLAESPRLVEREVFVSGLESSQLNAVKACANALKKLPRSSDAAEQFALLSAARRLINDEPEFKVRELIMRLLQNNTGQANGFVFGKDGHLPQPDAMRAWQEYLEARYPEFRPVTADDITLASYSVIQQVNWDSGDAAAGKLLFEKLSCAKCHGGRKALGPDLTGVAKRFSREDLFAAIVEPDRDVSSRYQTTTVVTIAGKVYSGLVVYRSVDGLLLRDAEQNTYRFEEAEIESQQKRRTSLMPAGLLKNVEASQIADLYQYLRSL